MLNDLLKLLLTEEFLYATIRIATPIILAALGEVFLERSGVINLGMEGMMLMGALFGVVGASMSGNTWIGLLTAIVIGVVVALIFGLSVITLRANQIVAGAAINITALGLTTFLNRVIFGIRPLPVQINVLTPWPVPILSKIPVIGHVLFEQDPLVYLAYFVIIISTFILFRTTWGLKIRSVGEHPRAADTVGISVNKWRYICLMFNGVMCGIAGASLSLVQLNTFTDNMTTGRGFIAMAAVIFGRWNPIGAALASLVFGGASALQLRLQAFQIGISNQFLLMIPYLLTLVGVIIFRGHTATPKALAKPYAKEES
ncbi:MAG: ABC transporter permease [Anaerolineaceae bacterium]|nr:ABC transporter permease [Anaerolineaceae bacterium]